MPAVPAETAAVPRAAIRTLLLLSLLPLIDISAADEYRVESGNAASVNQAWLPEV